MRPASPGGPVTVTVLMLVYNQAPVLREALESVLMQRTSFPCEILVHDDASTDGSQEIIREYAARYPDLLVPILQRDNQMQQGISIVDRFLMPRVRGQYIAHCEGDDYWTDPRKLEKQVAFLRKHPGYAGVTHNCRFVNREGCAIPSVRTFRPVRRSFSYTLQDLQYEDRMPGQTATLVYRHSVQTGMSEETRAAYQAIRAVVGDRRRALLILLNGPIYCHHAKMSAYRYVPESGGSWNARIRGRNLAGAYFVQELDFRRFAHEGFRRKLPNDFALFGYGWMALYRRLRHPTKENREQLLLAVHACGGYQSFLTLWLRALPGALRTLPGRLLFRLQHP